MAAHSPSLRTDIINYSSFHCGGVRGVGGGCIQRGFSLMIRLHQINPARRSPRCLFFFPPAAARGRAATTGPRAAPERFGGGGGGGGGPAAAHVWRGRRGSCQRRRRAPGAESRSVSEAKGCGGDVITPEGSFPANYWRRRESDVLALIRDGREGVWDLIAAVPLPFDLRNDTNIFISYFKSIKRP